MYAIVKTGGKQYTVAVGDKINVEKLDAEVGAVVELPALFIADGDKFITDPAKAAAVKVEAKVLEQFKGEKVFVVKFQKRKSYKKRNGHRQLLTRIEILSIGEGKPAKKTASKKSATEVAETPVVETPVVEAPVVEVVAEAPKKAPAKKAPAKKAVADVADVAEAPEAEAPAKKAPAKKTAAKKAAAPETAE